MNVKISTGWKAALDQEFSKPYFGVLVQKVRAAYASEDVWPKGKNIFRAFDACDFDDIKVVILGQDPYPTPGHAHGLCFSVEENVRPLPKSLVNIFKEITDDLGKIVPPNGHLERWAKQGVFLLNTSLTVVAHQPNSHRNIGWEKFTDAVIQTISKQKENVVFLLWGSHAINKSPFIDRSKHTILTSVHPSPLSAYRGFFGCKHFSKTNEVLTSQGLSPIDW